MVLEISFKIDLHKKNKEKSQKSYIFTPEKAL